mgnify:CR=1 FL=1
MPTLLQMGYLGSVGPVFVLTDVAPDGVILVQGYLNNGVLTFKAKAPYYAVHLRSFGNNQGVNEFFFKMNECSLGPYLDNQDLEFPELTKYRIPNFAVDDPNSFEYYMKITSLFVDKDRHYPAPTNSTNPTNTTNPSTTTNPGGGNSTQTGNANTTSTGTATTTTTSRATSQKALNSVLLVGLLFLSVFVLNVRES